MGEGGGGQGQALEHQSAGQIVHRVFHGSTPPLTQIIKNFILLSLQESEIFGEQLVIEPNVVHAANSTPLPTQRLWRSP